MLRVLKPPHILSLSGQVSRATFHFHSFQGSFLPENHQQLRENGFDLAFERQWVKTRGNQALEVFFEALEGSRPSFRVLGF